jgi:hypothetical protein
MKVTRGCDRKSVQVFESLCSCFIQVLLTMQSDDVIWSILTGTKGSGHCSYRVKSVRSCRPPFPFVGET